MNVMEKNCIPQGRMWLQGSPLNAIGGSIGSAAMGSSLFLRLAQYFHGPKTESVDVANRAGCLWKPSKFTPSLQDTYRS